MKTCDDNPKKLKNMNILVENTAINATLKKSVTTVRHGALSFKCSNLNNTF